MALLQVTGSGSDELSHEHKYVTVSCIRWDYDDLQKLICYLSQYSPFRFMNKDSAAPVVMVLAVMRPRILASRYLGSGIISHTVHLKCLKQTVRNLSVLSPNSICAVSGTVAIDPNNLCHRLVLVGERTDAIRDSFTYKLTPYTTALFNGIFTCKL